MDQNASNFLIEQCEASDFLTNYPKGSVDLVLTSPPYWCQRRYGDDPRELGTEPKVTDYIEHLAAVLHCAWQPLAQTGWLCVNIADTYAVQPGGYRYSQNAKISASNRKNAATAPMRNLTGLPYKSQVGVPERLKLAMIDLGWRCRNTIIWHKTNPLPTTAEDRWFYSYEVVHCFARSKHSFFDKRGSQLIDYSRTDVWSISASKKSASEHPALMPESLVLRLIEQLSPLGGLVIDPFAGSGTVPRLAAANGRIGHGGDLLNWNERRIKLGENGTIGVD